MLVPPGTPCRAESPLPPVRSFTRSSIRLFVCASHLDEVGELGVALGHQSVHLCFELALLLMLERRVVLGCTETDGADEPDRRGDGSVSIALCTRVAPFALPMHPSLPPLTQSRLSLSILQQEEVNLHRRTKSSSNGDSDAASQSGSECSGMMECRASLLSLSHIPSPLPPPV